jgi:hypothetical protein
MYRKTLESSLRADGSEVCSDLHYILSSCQQNTQTQSAVAPVCTYASPGVSVNFKYFSTVICSTYFISICN